MYLREIREIRERDKIEIERLIREAFNMLFFRPKRIQSVGCDHRRTTMTEATVVKMVRKYGREKVTCVLCQKAILLPPAVICDICDHLIHISCLQVEYVWKYGRNVEQIYLEWDEYLQTLFLHCGPRHGLILEEEEKPRYYENKQVVCFACNEPLVTGPAYKCSASHCPLLFHKSCAHLSRQTKHPLYVPNDTFVMELAMRESMQSLNHCNICGKRCINCVYYKNIAGEFVLDVTCAKSWPVSNPYDCQPHAVIPIKGNFHFTCQVCGMESWDLASQCTTCRLLVHGNCSRFSRAVSILNHEHPLSFTFPLRSLKDSHNLSCNVCRKRMNAEYAAYSCKVCDFVAHLHCTDSLWLRDESEESMALVSHDVEEVPLAEIHPHDLILNDEQLMEDKVCDVCMQFIQAPPFYHCVKCNFFLHPTCARLPKERRHPRHHHTLTFLSTAPYLNGIFCCSVCYRHHNGFTYNCELCDFNIDIHCCSIPQVQIHPSHQHPLFLAIRSEKSCNACQSQSSFLCIDCNYSLCYHCITLPLEVRHQHDEHPLELTYVVEDKYGEYYCLICEGERDLKGWFYYCSKCNFPAHIECIYGRFPYIKVRGACKDDNHKHPLNLVRARVGSFPNCDACGKSFLNGLALECTQCKFNVHFQPFYKLTCLQEISKHFKGEEGTS